TDDYRESQQLAKALKAAGSNGVAYPSLHHRGGECVGLFYPDRASHPVQGRHLDYHWNGERVDLVRDPGSGEVYRVIETGTNRSCSDRPDRGDHEPGSGSS